jgi:hypothetical protein
MASKSKELSDLQRDLLQLALQGPKAKIWLPKASQQSFPTTYAAVVGLQRRGLLDIEQAKDPDILSWKVTKEGREALKVPKAEPAPRRQASPAPASGQSTSKAVAPAAPKQGSPSPPATGAVPRSRSANGKAPVPPAKPGRSAQAASAASAGTSREKGSRGQEPAPGKSGRSARPVSAAPAEAPRERGAKGKVAAPTASRNAGKKPAAAAKKSGGRGRT